jgi:hypothetical protein
MGKFSSPLAPIANFMAHFKPLRIVAEMVMGVHRNAPLPPFSFETFRGWYKAVYKKNNRQTKPITSRAWAKRPWPCWNITALR